TVALLRVVAERGLLTAAVVDFLGRLLRQVSRHLTAYDLVTFHHHGANYPDALLLDALLKAYLDLARRQPQLFSGDTSAAPRRRRRAWRRPWFGRRRSEGHPVRAAPPSQGETLRVLPPPPARVREEQTPTPLRRTRQLFAADPLDARLRGLEGLLRQSLLD